MKDIIREKIIEKNYELLVHFNDKDKVRKIRMNYLS